MKANENKIKRVLREAQTKIVYMQQQQQEPDIASKPTADSVISTLQGVWVDPRVVSEVKDIIAKYGNEMTVRTRDMNPYDCCVQWIDVLVGNGMDTEMYMGNGGHYWLSTGNGIFDPKAEKVVGYPDITADSYNAEKVIWRNNDRVNQDILNEMPIY